MHWTGLRGSLGAMLASSAIILPAAQAEAQGRLLAATRAERPALHYTRAPGAESCIGPTQIARSVEGIVGPVLVGPADADVILEATAGSVADGFVLHVRLLDPQERELGERALAAKETDCRELDALWTFVLALMLDPSAALMALPPELEAALDEQSAGAALLEELTNEAKSTQAVPHPKPHQSDAESRETASQSGAQKDSLAPVQKSPATVETRAWLAVGPVWGVGPKVTAGASLGVDVTRAPWLVRARAAGWLPRTVALDGGSGPSARFVGGQLSLLAGPAELELGSLRAKVAAGAFGGLLHAAGDGVSATESVLRPTYGAALEAGLRWPISRKVSLSVDVAAQWNARRDRFYVTSSTARRDYEYSLPVAALAGWIGVVLTPRGSALR